MALECTSNMVKVKQAVSKGLSIPMLLVKIIPHSVVFCVFNAFHIAKDFIGHTVLFDFFSFLIVSHCHCCLDFANFKLTNQIA